MEGEKRMEWRGGTGGISQPVFPAAVEDIEGPSLQILLRPAGGIEGDDTPAVCIHHPARAA